MKRSEKINLLKDLQAGRSVIRIENAILISIAGGSYQNKRGKSFSESSIKKLFKDPLLLEVDNEDQAYLIFNVG